MKLRFVDSHTAGEPTRVILDFPELPGTTIAEKAEAFTRDHADLLAGILAEPRGSDVYVGALLIPEIEGADFGVIFFNTAGLLGMCGHGTIGVGVTLQHLGLRGPGPAQMATKAGLVDVNLLTANQVSLRNITSYRLAADVPCLDYVGDIAYGGNWFYIVKNPPSINESPDSKLVMAREIMAELYTRGISGADRADIDHVEFVYPGDATCDSQNFVLCPSGAFDRSPCGTGTSAKLACLAADGKLAPADEWRVRGISGECFVGSYEPVEGGIRPTIRGEAYITAEGTLIFDENDPLRNGLRWR